MFRLLHRIFHSELSPLVVMDHVPLQLPQPDWETLRAQAALRHGKPFRCDIVTKVRPQNKADAPCIVQIKGA